MINKNERMRIENETKYKNESSNYVVNVLDKKHKMYTNYARRAYMGRTDRLQQIDTVYIDHFLQYQDSVLRAVTHLNEDTSIMTL